jgi:hypothetical protein
MVRRALVALCVLGCGGRPLTGSPNPPLVELTLYRDRALVAQRVELMVPAGGRATAAIRIAPRLSLDDLQIIERGGLVVVGRRLAGAPAPPVPSRPAPVEDPIDPDEDVDLAARAARAVPGDVELAVEAARPGRYSLVVGYTTDLIRWSAAYTMTTTVERSVAVVRGAIAVRNASGLALRARTHVVDAELGGGLAALAELAGDALVRAPRGDATPRRDLGVVAIADGETRIELLAGDPPRRMRSVLVYDPIGVALDHPGAVPVFEPALGAGPDATSRITESFEIDRDDRGSRGLPGAPVRLLERRSGGALAMLGTTRLFDAASRGGATDVVAIGTADGVVGHRVRRDWTHAAHPRRFSEEFLITLDNTRPRPVEVVVREHLYRGQNWTLAYNSVPAVKEGPQQIALRVTVPASGQAKVLYVVVYTW